MLNNVCSPAVPLEALFAAYHENDSVVILKSDVSTRRGSIKCGTLLNNIPEQTGER